MTFEKYLSDYAGQDFTEKRDLQVETNPRLDALVEAYEGWLCEDLVNLGCDINYDLASEAVANLSYTACEVRNFSVHLAEYQDHVGFFASGVFLSALVNGGEGNRYEIITEHLMTPLDGLGYLNRKEVVVLGNTGHWVGRYMSGGTGMIHGDIGTHACFEMTGGSMVVEGNATIAPGYMMRGGSLVIKGNTGESAGLFMKGGKLQVLGEIGSVGKTLSWGGGEIWNGERLVWGTLFRRVQYALRGEWR